MNADPFAAMRRAMVVSQLRPNGVTDPRVIDAMGRVPRENFVPEDRRATAYADLPLLLAPGKALNPPMVTGRLLNEARIVAGDTVLIVGNATGYSAAVVASLTDRVVVAATGEGAPDDGPFDAIVIDGAVEFVPDALVEQLAPTGRLVTAIVDAGVTRLAIGRRGGGGFGLDIFADADAVVLPGFSSPHAFVF